MPKNAHPPRGKPAKKTVPPEEDTSFIVFGDGKPKRKKPEKPNDDAASSDTKGKGKAEDGPKKPDTRTLIAGASWTGKLPVNLLAEHFQKQHWSKPDYRIVRAPIGSYNLPADLHSAKMARSTLLMPSSCPR
jgi:ATP-dependent RNA helicase DHX57